MLLLLSLLSFLSFIFVVVVEYRACVADNSHISENSTAQNRGPSDQCNITIYYINANEIPGELSRENLISSHVKISPLLWLHNKSHLSHQKTIKVKWFGISLVFM